MKNQLFQMYEESITRREEGKWQVVQNLEYLSSLMRSGIPSVYDLTPSCSSSLIQVSTGSQSISKSSPIINAIDKQDRMNNFLNRMLFIIEMLPENERKIIQRKYSLKKVEYASEYRVHLIIDQAYEDLAILDPEIDYTREDQLRILQYEMPEQSQKYSVIKQYVLNLLIDYRKRNNTEDDIENALKVIPKNESKTLYRYIETVIEEKKIVFSRYEYYKLKRAIITFAYFFPKIDISYQEWLALVSSSGHGSQTFIRTVLETINEDEQSIVNIPEQI